MNYLGIILIKMNTFITIFLIKLYLDNQQWVQSFMILKFNILKVYSHIIYINIKEGEEEN